MQYDEINSEMTQAAEEGAAAPADSEGTNDTSATAPAEEIGYPPEEGEAPPDAEEDDGRFATLEREDLAALAEALPTRRLPTSLAELENPERYGELREAGLSPLEAYLATEGHRLIGRPQDSRRHLSTTVGRAARLGGERIGSAELSAARELFPSLSDGEIEALWRRVDPSGRR